MAAALALAAVLTGSIAGLVAWGALDGARPFAVVSGSMSPAIDVGDAVVAVPTDQASPGEVITFMRGHEAVTHRVIDVTDDGYRTKGDANEAADLSTIAPEQVVGVVEWRIPAGGYVLVYLQQPAGLASLLVLPFVLRSGWLLADAMAARPTRLALQEAPA